MLFLFQCHALISDGSLALCTALEQFNLVYLKNKLYEGKLPYWLLSNGQLTGCCCGGMITWSQLCSCNCLLRVRIFLPLWPLPSPHPDQGRLVKVRHDPAELQHCFFWGGRGAVFVVASALRSFILKLVMVTSIFLKTFLFLIVGRADSTCKGLRDYSDHPYLLVKTRTLYTFFNAREVDY